MSDGPHTDVGHSALPGTCTWRYSSVSRTSTRMARPVRQRSAALAGLTLGQTVGVLDWLDGAADARVMQVGAMHGQGGSRNE